MDNFKIEKMGDCTISEIVGKIKTVHFQDSSLLRPLQVVQFEIQPSTFIHGRPISILPVLVSKDFGIKEGVLCHLGNGINLVHGNLL